MKYFLILLLSFAFINPALAAKAVKGTVPQLKPLQPAPAGIFPAYSKNIQHQDVNYVPSNGNPNVKSAPEEQLPGQNPALGQSSTAAALTQSSPARHYVWWIIVLLAALILGFFVYKRRRRDKVIP